MSAAATRPGISAEPAITPLRFRRDFRPDHGAVERISPLIRRVTACNPGPFTFTGTGTYVIGHGRVAVIDPGPDDARHLQTLRAALAGEAVTHILVTHTHLDHSPLAAALSACTDAPIYAWHRHEAASDTGEAGTDHDFHADVGLSGGETLSGDGWTLSPLHTPGHASDHLCFHLPEESALFTGDHVMGWSTSVVSPPDGDMGAYMRSLRLLLARDEIVYYPTHGAPIDRPREWVRALVLHREERETGVLAALTAGDRHPDAMVARLYPDLAPALVSAAGRSVLAHLIALERAGRAVRAPDGSWSPGDRPSC